MPTASTVVASICLAIAGTASADIASFYDLDSLVYLADEIVEVDVLATRDVPHYAAGESVEARVARTDQGMLAVGETVTLSSMSSYRVGTDSPASGRPFTAGDRLVLFLVRGKDGGAGGTAYRPLPDGIRLIDGDRIRTFSRWVSPGPFSSGPPPDRGSDPDPTLAEFRGRIAAGRTLAAQVRAWTEADPEAFDAETVTRFVIDRGSSLWERHTALGFRHDALAARLIEALAARHDIERLDRIFTAWATRPPFDPESLRADGSLNNRVIGPGLATPTGREHLVGRLGDATLPVALRRQYADLLSHVGGDYWTVGREAVDPPPSDDRPPNAAFLTRLAEIGRAAAKEPAFRRELLGRAAGTLRPPTHLQPSPEWVSDHGRALDVIQGIYETGPDDDLAFEIEHLLAETMPERYGSLDSPCGPFVSRLTPEPDPARFGPVDPGQLIFFYTYASLRWTAKTPPTLSLVLEPVAGGRRFTVPSPLKVGWGLGGGGSDRVTLPPDLPPGRYRVRYEVTTDGEVVSTGHGFEIALPSTPASG